MHEMSLVRKLVEVVLAECEGISVVRVDRVNLTIGEMRDVVDEYVPDLFRFLAKGTVADAAEIEIRRMPIMVRCNSCGDIFHIDSHDPKTWECPRCHAYQNYRLFSGGEFNIESISVTTREELEETNAVAKGTRV